MSKEELSSTELDQSQEGVAISEVKPSENSEATITTSSGIEDLAKRYGWNPEGEKSAEEFVEFALKEVPDRGKELKRYKRTIDELKVHMQKQQEYAYKQAKEELEAQKKMAQENHDYDAYNKLQQQEKQLQPVNAEVLAALDEFKERNADWNDLDNIDTLDMRDWAAKRDLEIAKLGLSPREHLEKLEQDIHKKFPDYFKKSSSRSVPAVQSDGNSGVTVKSSNKKPTLDKLPKHFQETAERYERTGVMTKEEYLADLIKWGEI